jgi:hypothetical protein
MGTFTAWNTELVACAGSMKPKAQSRGRLSPTMKRFTLAQPITVYTH